MSQKYFIGVDISKAKIDVAIIDRDFKVILERKVRNEDKSISSFLKALLKKFKADAGCVLVCCETTGIYNRPLERVCIDLHVSLWVEHALKIKKASSDIRGKTDRKDALRIAQYALRYQDRMVTYKQAPGIVRKASILNKARETFMAQKVALENQLREARSHDKEAFKGLEIWYKSALKDLTKNLQKIDKQIELVLKEEPEVKKNVELMKSIPGIGTQSAIQLIIHTHNFSRFTSSKHLACYAGVVPFANESGTIIKRQRVSKMANQKLKMTLHLAAMAAIRSKSELKAYFIRKVKEGKNKMSVLNAVRNKLLHRIWAVIQNQRPYIPNINPINLEQNT